MSLKLSKLLIGSNKALCSLSPKDARTFLHQLKPNVKFLHTQRLTPTLSLISNGRLPSSKKQSNKTTTTDISQFQAEGRPLSILITWLMAKNNAVHKYTEFYLDHGFDVLTVRITPKQLLLPKLIEPVIQKELLPVLLSAGHQEKLIHGFSVGGYVFARMLHHLYAHPEGSKVISSMKAQVWDSVVDVNGVSIGVSKSVFGKNRVPQQLLQSYIDFHMKVFHSIATKYYEMAHEVFYENPLKAPALFLNSERDLISTMNVIQDVNKVWEKKGIPCERRFWPDTQHVGHMRAYPEEYKGILKGFLQKHGVHKGSKVLHHAHDHHHQNVTVENHDVRPSSGGILQPAGVV